MKGVSAVIAIILILMIVVALAALAYTWFTGIFSDLTASAGESITQSTSQMSLSFSLESVTCGTAGCPSGSTLTVVIRNTGTGDIVADSVGVYLDEFFQSTTCGSGVDVDSLASCTVTTNRIGNCGTSVVKATIGSGIVGTKTLAC
ncbi:MAG: archaellin/type IV pilin N-terminal domain-containing protein [Candidatus Aenigmatarchaeota archaeon]